MDVAEPAITRLLQELETCQVSRLTSVQIEYSTESQLVADDVLPDPDELSVHERIDSESDIDDEIWAEVGVQAELNSEVSSSNGLNSSETLLTDGQHNEVEILEEACNTSRELEMIAPSTKRKEKAMQAAAYLELIRQALEKKAHYQELNRIRLESYRGIESEDEEASIATTRGGDSEGDETSEDVETERRPAMEDEPEMQEMLKRLGFVLT
ncbi:hypothetical protein R1flu_022347 [Riccia fluitans]|uniref:Uncharacterized protein n=1 Tax=Riccia fluitans TaxID=41844 RepID=A0ABD1ZUU2_9MARC